jgi:hypothetical protein
MAEGLLWYDNDPRRTLAAKVSAAEARYLARRGRRPNAVLVNPADVDDSAPALAVQVRGNILRHHLLVVETKEQVIGLAAAVQSELKLGE